MQNLITRNRLMVGAATLLTLVAVPVALATPNGGSQSAPARASGIKRTIRKLKQQVAQLQQQIAALQGEQGGGRPPSGPAGGDLTGTYPNPQIATGVVGLADLDFDPDDRYWRLDGNAGTTGANFLGTTDNQQLTLAVNNARALRLEPGSDGTNQSPNVIGGIADNSVTPGVFAATISGGGRSDPADSSTASVVSDDYGTVGGGGDNQAGDTDANLGDATFATVGGGLSNSARGLKATVGGGEFNAAISSVATVGGGAGNTAGAQGSGVAGGERNTANRLDATVAGGLGNAASGTESAVGGGQDNTASGLDATVGGGFTNTASGQTSTVAGGSSNEVSQTSATIGGGFSNLATAQNATVAGGQDGTANAGQAAVGGGLSNTASAIFATVGGGNNNSASGASATVPGGAGNEAKGAGSFAAGAQAKANQDGTFVWADSTNADMASTAANQFIARASGHFFLQGDSTLDNQNGFINTSTGAFLSTGGTWTNASDENLKAGFGSIDPGEILDRVANLPITSWHYKVEPGVEHIGPVAQDFYREFGVGPDDLHISSVDADGVALAAIKGLNDKVEALKGRGTSPNASGGSPSSSLPPLALAALATLGLTLAAAFGATLALRWSGRPDARIAMS